MPTLVGSRAAHDALPALQFRVEEIDRIAAPSREAFVREYMRPRRPVILTGITDSWLPPREWTLERMATRYGSARVVAAVLANERIREDPRTGVTFFRIALREFVESLSGPEPATYYVMAPTANFPEDLQRDYRTPDYCDSASHLRAKVWIGKQGTVTPLHRDVPHNFNVHLTGRKRWLLFSPKQSRQLYSRFLSGMPNFSQVDPEQPDLDRYPRFRDVTALGATLNGGEALFIPCGWWHHVRSLDDTVAMNFWWGGRLIHAAALASHIFKRMSGIARNEWA